MMTSQREVSASQMEVLNSWKEIAQYLGRGVRTVQRWEATLGLPVRRPHGRGRSAVIAMRADLDRWLKACPTRNGFETATHPENGLTVREKASIDLLLQSQRLRNNLRESREELMGSIQRMLQTLGKMATTPTRPARLAADGETGRGTFL